MSNRWCCLLSVVALIAVSGCSKPAAAPVATGRGGAQQTQVVEVAPIVRRDLIETLKVVGSLAANESAQIRPEIAGLVEEILFTEGQTVTKGQALLKIEDTELRAQYAQVEARFQLAELNVARSESLSETKTISQSETDRARSEFGVARAELALLRTRLDKSVVKAPFDGVVGGRIVSPGDYVTTQTVITALDDLTRLKVEFQVPERYLDKVDLGTSFRVTSSSIARSQEVRGEVYFVSSVINRNTRSSEIKGLVTDPPAVLKPGMFANIELVLEVRPAVLTVPEGAILVSSGNTSQLILVRERGGAKVADFVRVELGMRTPGLVQVSAAEGVLAENQLVVASGVGALILFPGAPLDPRPLRSEFEIGP